MVAISGEKVELEGINKAAEVFKDAIDGDTPEKRLDALVELKKGGYFISTIPSLIVLKTHINFHTLHF